MAAAKQGRCQRLGEHCPVKPMPDLPLQWQCRPTLLLSDDPNSNPKSWSSLQNKAKALRAELLEFNLKNKLEETGKTR